MTGQDLLQRRAERGSPRGAANVWTDAQIEQPTHMRAEGSWVFRLVLAVGTIGVGAVAALSIASSSETATSDIAPPAAVSEGDPSPAEDDLPLPIFVEGATLQDSLPACIDFLAGCVPIPLDDPGMEMPENEFGIRTLQTLVYADEDDPFSNRVLGIENFEGGFRTWSLNTDQETNDELVEQVVLEGGEWVLPLESGLVEVARFDGYPIPDGSWQFDFVDGERSIGLQPLRARSGQSASEWQWIVPLVRSQPDVNLRTLDVLDQVGVVVQISQEAVFRENGFDPSEAALLEDLVWVDGDFVYRLTASGPELTDHRVDDVAERLTVVDRAIWLSAVDDTVVNENFEALIIVGVFAIAMVVVLALLIWLVRLVVRSRRTLRAYQLPE